MSNLKIEQNFVVNAAPDKVWAFLKDPAQVVTCLPGAGLDEVIDDRNYAGNVKIKVGPVTVAYKGKATLTEVDEDNRKVQIHGAGKEKAGGGNVTMDMTGHVEPKDDGSLVSFVAEVKLAGKIVRFGRGMIETVSDHLFAEFVEKARVVLEVPVVETNLPTETTAREAGGPSTAPTKHEQQAVDGVSLLFKALWTTVTRFFRGLLGLKEKS